MNIAPLPDRRPRRSARAALVTDLVAVALGWFVFNIIRFYSLPGDYETELGWWLRTPIVLMGQVVVPACMLLMYAFCGCYRNRSIPSVSRLDMTLNAVGVSAVGTLGIFFTVLLNDKVPERLTNYEILLILFGCLFVPVAAARLLLRAWRNAHPSPAALQRHALLYLPGQPESRTLVGMERSATELGYKLVGTFSGGKGVRAPGLPDFRGKLAEICEKEHIQAIFIPLADMELLRNTALMNSLYRLEMPVYAFGIGTGMMAMRPRLSAVRPDPVVDVASVHVAPLTANFKRLADIALSGAALIVLSPLLAVLAVAIRLDSSGPVFYRQQRLGLHRHPFNIVKFRTMRTDAENGCPMLSSENDPRITRTGRWLRKYRLDELPQFWNVLRGDMSIVGPRPERPYFAAQLLEREAAYTLIHHVRPGITSWGMVKYGYASTVDEMMDRLPYDLLYIQNVSMVIDLKILLHTVATVLTGRGV